jgi:hypothetical protein
VNHDAGDRSEWKQLTLVIGVIALAMLFASAVVSPQGIGNVFYSIRLPVEPLSGQDRTDYEAAATQIPGSSTKIGYSITFSVAAWLIGLGALIVNIIFRRRKRVFTAGFLVSLLCAGILLLIVAIQRTTLSTVEALPLHLLTTASQWDKTILVDSVSQWQTQIAWWTGVNVGVSLLLILLSGISVVQMRRPVPDRGTH